MLWSAAERSAPLQRLQLREDGTSRPHSWTGSRKSCSASGQHSRTPSSPATRAIRSCAASHVLQNHAGTNGSTPSLGTPSKGVPTPPRTHPALHNRSQSCELRNTPGSPDCLPHPAHLSCPAHLVPLSVLTPPLYVAGVDVALALRSCRATPAREGASTGSAARKRHEPSGGESGEAAARRSLCTFVSNPETNNSGKRH